MKPHNTSDRLKQIMAIRRIKQADILEMSKPYCQKYKIKMGKSALSQYVSGKTEPGQAKLTILSLALNVSEAWLMGYDVPMERSSHHSSAQPSGIQPLVQKWSQLNREGQEKLLDYADTLVSSGKYAPATMQLAARGIEGTFTIPVDNEDEADALFVDQKDW